MTKNSIKSLCALFESMTTDNIRAFLLEVVRAEIGAKIRQAAVTDALALSLSLKALEMDAVGTGDRREVYLEAARSMANLLVAYAVDPIVMGSRPTTAEEAGLLIRSVAETAADVGIRLADVARKYVPAPAAGN